MREYDNSKIHISKNSLLSICLLTMLDTFYKATLHQIRIYILRLQVTTAELIK